MRRFGSRRLIVALAFSVLGPGATARAGELVLPPDASIVELTPHAEVFVDPTAALTIGEVADGPHAEAFEPLIERAPNFGRSRAVVWLRTRLVTPDAPSDFAYVLVEWPRLEDVRVYWRDDGDFRVRESGWRVPFSERDVDAPLHVFRVPVSDRSSTELWIRVQSRSELIFPASVAWPRAFSLVMLSMGLFTGTVYGVIGALTLLNFFVFLRLRRPYQLYFVLSVMCFAWAWLLSSGYYGALGALARNPLPLPAILTALAMFFRVAFTRSFLRVDTLSPRYDRVLSVLQWVAIPAITLISTFYALFMDGAPALPGLDTIILGLCVGAGVLATRQGVPLAGAFTAAMSLLLVGWLSATFIFRGLALPPAFSGLAILLGTISELMVISWVLVQDLLRESKQRDETLRRMQSERLSALHGLVAGVVHELNSPVGSLRSASDTLGRAADRVRQAPPSERADIAGRLAESLPSLAQTSLSATERIQALVSSLRRFARLDESREKIANLAEGLDASIVLLEPRLQNIEVVKEYEEVPLVRCRPVEINQVFMSVLDNAVKAMPKGGRLTVRLMNDDGAVRVEIEDTGVGIEPARLSRIFEPQLIARGERVRLGLGLSTSGQIISDHQGRLEIRSEPDVGTCVIVTLPRDANPPTSRDAS